MKYYVFEYEDIKSDIRDKFGPMTVEEAETMRRQKQAKHPTRFFLVCANDDFVYYMDAEKL